MFKETITYEDVLLVPKYSEIKSRTECDIGTNLGSNLKLVIPIISSPMDTVTEVSMGVKMSQNGGLAIIHRYNTIEKQVDLVKGVIVRHDGLIGAAIGATGDYLERAQELVNTGVKVICVDVAHGHHLLMKEALAKLTLHLPSSIHIMAGNVATKEGFKDLQNWGANSIRVGIGNGSICSTRMQTGHGVPSLTAIMECCEVADNAGVIADGGIKTSGDIVKALAAGADAVMLGSMLAGTAQSPGETIWLDDKQVKTYRGMASSEAQNSWRGKSSTPEGISTTIPYKGDVQAILDDLVGGIKSGLSYSGARSLQELRFNAEFIRQTNAGQHESWTHILSGK